MTGPTRRRRPAPGAALALLRGIRSIWPFPRSGPVAWPGGKRFAFTIFDDTDDATLANLAETYALLADLGFRITKSVWPTRHVGAKPRVGGTSCEDDAAYVAWLRQLANRGFEIGYHNAACSTSTREETRRGLERFQELFGHPPRAMANHTGCAEGIYWGEARLEGLNRRIFNVLTRNVRKNAFRGHVETDELFWGDLCRAQVKYVRNFVFADLDTLASCPFMPYHDAKKPYVNYWFASSDGARPPAFHRCVTDEAVDRLEAEGGACIMYTHLAYGFYEHGHIDPRFRATMQRIAAKDGWFVPVSELLDFLLTQRGHHDLSGAERTALEALWIVNKAVLGPS